MASELAWSRFMWVMIRVFISSVLDESGDMVRVRLLPVKL